MPIRLLVGLHFLKHAFGESDESVVERFVENPYWHVRRIKIWHIDISGFCWVEDGRGKTISKK